jgi:hypothetical protein
MGKETFIFAEILRETRTLRGQVEAALLGSKDDKVRDLAREIPSLREGKGTGHTSPLSLAFVGQYNAGKSTLISALTGRRDIPIDADVCTDKVTAYDWNGILLLDTPGIHAGYPDHDSKTYAAIDRADLLVFVISNELFDDVTGPHFRSLAFEKNKAREMMLVVNKMTQDPGTPEIKKPDIERVTAPLKCEDFRTVFVDALAYLEALDAEDPQEQDELRAVAGMGNLVESLNGFVRDREFMGRLTTPLFTLRSLTQQAEAYLSVDFPEERAALELLHRKGSILLASKTQLRSALRGIISRGVSDITTYGDMVAESIEPGKRGEDVQKEHEAAQQRANQRCEKLAEEVRLCVENALHELDSQMKSLEGGVLARALQTRMSRPASGREEDQSQGVMWEPRMDTMPADWPARAKKIGDVANSIGQYATEWARGPLAEAARAGSATAARGSQAHQVVYNVGKFFGAKFQPWGAVRVARAVGNAGRVIAAVGGVLAVVAQVAEDRQKEKERVQLRDARDGVRTAYRDSALAVETDFWQQFERFCKDFYDVEIEAVQKQVAELAGRSQGRTEETRTFKAFSECATALICRVQEN